MTVTFMSMFDVVLKDFSSFVAVAVERGSIAMVGEAINIFHLLLGALTLGLLTAAIANHKGGSLFKWFLAGSVFGILALPIAIFKLKKVAAPARKQCPNCAAEILIHALICDACNYNFLFTLSEYRHRQIESRIEHLA